MKLALLWRSPFFAVHVVIIFLVLALIAAILILNEGKFIYTLDDPYIHLALSENIRLGEYGVNRGEFSAPSSSILFPFVLAIGASWSFHEFLPFVLNVFFLFLTLEILRRFTLELGFGVTNQTIAIAAVLVGLLAVTFNLVGLVFSGMEHSAHVAVTAATILGLAIYLKKGRMAWWFPACIVLGPVIRYEAISLSFAALLVMAMSGRWKTTLATAVAIVGLVGGFSVFLLSMGLGPLPTSVLIKSSLAAAGVERSLTAELGAIYRNADQMLNERVGLLMALSAAMAGVFIVINLMRKRAFNAPMKMALVMVLVILGHAVAGRFGWFARYEVYAMTAALMTGAFLAEPQIRKALITPHGRSGVLLSGAAALLIVGVPYVRATLLVPFATNNIYEQQYQMHRFLTEFHRAPVAVNDLGWTSYRNDYYVLDLYGLGSERARLLRMQGDVSFLGRLSREKETKVAIIYPEWFPGLIPNNWISIGKMKLGGKHVTPAVGSVEFFATDSKYANDARKNLQSFSRTLPRKVQLEIY